MAGILLSSFVILAKSPDQVRGGIQSKRRNLRPWITAFAGMTGEGPATKGEPAAGLSA